MYTYTLWIRYSFNTFFGLVFTWYGVSQSNLVVALSVMSTISWQYPLNQLIKDWCHLTGVGHVHIHVMDSVQFQYLFGLVSLYIHNLKLDCVSGEVWIGTESGNLVYEPCVEECVQQGHKLSEKLGITRLHSTCIFII